MFNRLNDMGDKERMFGVGHFDLISNQGGAGAHDGDLVGSIAVYGDIVNQSDLTVDKTVFYGAYESISVV